MTEQRNPGFDFCVGIARAFGEQPEKVLRLAGLLPPVPPEVAEEHEIRDLVRSLPHHERQNALAMLRGLAGKAAPSPAPARRDIQPTTDLERAAYALDQELQALPPDYQRVVFNLMTRIRELLGGMLGETVGALDTD